MEEFVFFLVVGILGIIGTVIVASLWITRRAGLERQRLEVLGELARQGHYDPEQFGDLVKPRPRWRVMKVLVVAAWFALIVGIGTITGAVFGGFPYEQFELGLFGLVCIGSSFAVLSAPIALREFKKAGIV